MLCRVRLVGQYSELASATRHNGATGEERCSAYFWRSRYGAQHTAHMPSTMLLSQPCTVTLSLQGYATTPGERNCVCVFCSGLSIMASTCKMVQACKRQGWGKAVECMCTFVCKEAVVTEAPRGLNPDLAFWKCTAPEKLPRYICMPKILCSFQFKTLGSDSCGWHANCRKAGSCSTILFDFALRVQSSCIQYMASTWTCNCLVIAWRFAAMSSRKLESELHVLCLGHLLC